MSGARTWLYTGSQKQRLSTTQLLWNGQGQIDSVDAGSPILQSITAVTRIGRPGAGNRAVLVEYASSQAKHRTYALSRQLRQQGLHLTDKLTPKQQQAQKALDTDCVALLSKGFCTWLRDGTLWYMDQGVRRECKKGTQGSSPAPQGHSTRVPARSPHSGRATRLRPSSAPRAAFRRPQEG